MWSDLLVYLVVVRHITLLVNPYVISQRLIWSNINPGWYLGGCGAPHGYYGLVGPANWNVGPWSCNDPFYSPMAACCDCQGGTWSDWATWVRPCNGSTFRTFEGTIPSGVVFPRWTELDIEVSGKRAPSLTPTDRGYKGQRNFRSRRCETVCHSAWLFL